MVHHHCRFFSFGQVRSKAFAFPGFYHKVFRAWMRVQCCGHSFCVTVASLLQNFWGDSVDFRGKIVERILVRVCTFMLCGADGGNWTKPWKQVNLITHTIDYIRCSQVWSIEVYSWKYLSWSFDDFWRGQVEGIVSIPTNPSELNRSCK